MFKDNPEGQTHSYNDGCGEPAHNGVKIPIEKVCEYQKHSETCGANVSPNIVCSCGAIPIDHIHARGKLKGGRIVVENSDIYTVDDGGHSATYRAGVAAENLAWLEGRRCVECGGAKEQGLSDTCKGCLENA